MMDLEVQEVVNIPFKLDEDQRFFIPAKVWDEVLYCSDRCRGEGRAERKGALDRETLPGTSPP